MRAPLLKRIAEDTGGRFFTPGQRRVAARSDQLQRPRRHRRRRARAVGHAGAVPRARRPDRRRVGLSPHAGPGVITPEKTAEIAKRAEHSVFCAPRALRVCAVRFVFSCSRGVIAAAVASRSRRICSSITGVPGDEEHAQKFQQVGDDVHRRGEEEGRRARREHHAARRGPSKATKATDVEKAVRRSRRAQRSRTTRSSSLLIGHGSFDGTTAAFNLPGPDLTVDDWAKLLGKLPSQHVAFVNTSSSSGAFLPADRRAGPRRRHRDQDRRRAQRDAVSRVLRRGLRPTTRPTAIATATSRCSKRSNTRRPK